MILDLVLQTTAPLLLILIFSWFLILCSFTVFSFSSSPILKDSDSKYWCIHWLSNGEGRIFKRERYLHLHGHCDYVLYHFHNGFRDGSGGDPPWDIISWLVLNQKVEKSKERSNRQQRPCLALMSSLLAYGGRGLALMS